MASSSLTGLASGLDTDAIVSQLMTIERQPRGRLELRQLALEARKAQLTDISSRLAALKTAAADLRSVATWAEGQAVSSSDATRVAARRTGGAGPGAYELEVTSLASAEQRTFTYTADGADSTIDVGAFSLNVAAGTAIADVASAINARADAPVYAVVTGGSKLTLSSRTAGAAGGFAATGSTIAPDAGTPVKPGTDAVFDIDGVTYTRTSNVVADVLPGLELTLAARTAPGSPVTLTVGPPAVDRDAVKAKINAFAAKYNETVEHIRSKLSEERVSNPTTTAQASRGLLRNDAALTGLLSTLRQSLGAAVAGNPAATDQLEEIGITAPRATGTRDAAATNGRLTVDTTRLDAALAADPTAVKRLLGGLSGVTGFAQGFEGRIAGFSDAGGLLTQRVDAAGTQITGVQRQLTEMDSRLAVKEKRLRAQFAALETALSASQTAGTWLSGQIASLQSQRG